jgi:taurine dioxygenase
MEIQLVSGAIGAEVRGIDLRDDIGGNEAAALNDALHNHNVLFFRDQSLEPRQQVSAAALFGEPDVYPFIEGMKDIPEVIEIIKTPTDARNFGGSWHSDTAYLPKPALGTMLYAVEVPPSGGDTMFANTGAAYEALSDGMREMLDDLVGVNDSDNGYGGSRAKVMAKLDTMKDSYNEAATSYRSEHPIVRTHPATGRKGLYVSRSHTERFKDMTIEESAPLINFLCDHIIRPEFTCRFRWTPGAVAIWDNRITQHYAINDYSGSKRHMRRVTLKGDTPV